MGLAFSKADRCPHFLGLSMFLPAGPKGRMAGVLPRAAEAGEDRRGGPSMNGHEAEAGGSG